MCDIRIAVFFEGYFLIVCNREGKKKTKLELSSLGVHVTTALTARVDKTIQLFRERWWEKKHQSARQDLKVVWVFTGILHIGLEEIYKFVFLHVENLFFLSGGLYL